MRVIFRRMSNIAESQAAFLKAFAQRGNVGGACEQSGVAPEAVAAWSDPNIVGEKAANAFKAQMDHADELFADTLVDEAVKRGRDGHQEPVIFQGQLMYQIDPLTGEAKVDDHGNPIPLTLTKRSDTVLLRLLEARSEGFKRGLGGAAALKVKGEENANGDRTIQIEFVQSDGNGNFLEGEAPE